MDSTAVGDGLKEMPNYKRPVWSQKWGKKYEAGHHHEK